LDTVLIDGLISVLNKETAMYEGILKLSKNKTDVIVEGKVTELESMTRLEQTMILQLGKLEAEREKLVDTIAAELKLKAPDITLAGLEKLFPKEQAEKLKACHNKLPKLVKDLGEANVLNAKLIRNSLDYIDFSINILTNVGATGNNYGYSGQSSDSKKRNFFDMKL
jgi:flagellar biosynthesis/type III secretory pathway chaperone